MSEFIAEVLEESKDRVADKLRMDVRSHVDMLFDAVADLRDRLRRVDTGSKGVKGGTWQPEDFAQDILDVLEKREKEVRISLSEYTHQMKEIRAWVTAAKAGQRFEGAPQ